MEETPSPEKTSFFFKSGSSEFLPISQNHDEQTPVLRWESRQDASVTKFKAEIYKGLNAVPNRKMAGTLCWVSGETRGVSNGPGWTFSSDTIHLSSGVKILID